MPSTPPRWDLTNVYPALESPEFKAAVAQVSQLIADFDVYLNKHTETAVTPPKELADAASGIVDRFNKLATLAGTIFPYISSFVSTNSYDNTAKRTFSEFYMVMVRLEALQNRVKTWIKTVAPALPQMLQIPGSAREHAFFINETAEQTKYMMSEAEENLASELSLSGDVAWSNLQGTVTSQIPVDFELDGEVKKLPITALINLRTHPDESVRRRAFEAEMKVWDTVREPLAAAMNGVKGTAITLNRHRGRVDALHPSIDQSRIDRSTLEAMLSAMQDSFPLFRKYYHAKAKLIGKEKLAWWDIYAPVGKTDTIYSYEDAKALILTNFRKFSGSLCKTRLRSQLD
jgi:oligoendopeptidase F